MLLVTTGLGYAFVDSFGEQDAALSVVLALATAGSGALLVFVVRRLLAVWKFTRYRNGFNRQS